MIDCAVNGHVRCGVVSTVELELEVDEAAFSVIGSWLQDYCYVAGGGAGHTQ